MMYIYGILYAVLYMRVIGLFYQMAGEKQTLTDKEILKRLGKRITELRKAKGYNNHEKFANAHDLNRPQYWSYEKGANLTFLSLLKITEALGVTLEEFFKDFNTLPK